MPGRSVKIINENVLATLQPTGLKGYKYLLSGGEEYACNCPFCNDTGKHLYINYRYGQQEEVGVRKKNFAVAHCFHGCLDKRENREELYRIIFAFPVSKSICSTIVPLGTAMTEDDRPISLPGGLIPIQELDEKHPAVQYLVGSRHFDMELLRMYEISYCGKSQAYPRASNKIVAPIKFSKELIGWQARRIGDGNGPKYYTAPGFKKSKVLYNFDSASLCNFVVLCEGITDVWRVGKEGVCLFGKVASMEQKRLLKETWKDKPILLLLDPDARAEAEKLKSTLESSFPVVSIVELPEGIKDAAELDSGELRRILERNLYENGM